MVPRSASSNLPRRIAAAPVNAPFSWPNSSLSISSVGIAAQLTLTNGPDAIGLSRWMCAASSSLPVPDSPDSSTATSERATCVRLLHRLLERGARADHLRRLADQLAKTLVLALQVGTLERVLHHQQHAIARQRLLEKIERAAARRVDGVADGAVAGDHHRGRRVVGLFQRSQHVDAVAVGQPQVEQVQVGARPSALGLEPRRRVANRDAIALALENQPQRQPDVRLVVHDHDVVTAGHDACSAATAAAWRQRNAERCAAQFAVQPRDVAVGEHRILLGNRQTESHAVFLEGDGGLEERGRGRFAQSGSRIVHVDEHPARRSMR